MSGIVESVADNWALLTPTLVALFGIFRYFRDRTDDRNRIADERFITAGTAISSNSRAAQLAGSIMLRTFLVDGAERFYSLVFDFAVGILRSRAESETDEKGNYVKPPADELAFYQSIVPAFSLSAKLLDHRTPQSHKPGLDAIDLKLDWLRIQDADISHLNLRNASFIQTEVIASIACHSQWTSIKAYQATFNEVDVSHSDLRSTQLDSSSFHSCKATHVNADRLRLANTHFRKSDLSDGCFHQLHSEQSSFDECDLSRSSFYIARFNRGGFFRSTLKNVDFDGAKFWDGFMFADCDLTGTDFQAAVLDQVIFDGSDLTDVNFDGVSSMNRAQMIRVKGLSREQLERFAEKWGIYIDSFEIDD